MSVLFFSMSFLALASSPSRLEDLFTQRLVEVVNTKPALITFVQPGCIPCKKQLTALQCVGKRLGAEKVSLFGVQAVGDRGEMQRALKPLRLSYPILVGTQKFLTAFGAADSATPLTAVVAPGGKVLERILGAFPCEYWVGKVVTAP